MKRKTYFFLKRKKVNYQEIVADSDMFDKFYLFEGFTDSELVVIPDGSVDIQCLWKDGNLRIFICGSVTNGKKSNILNFDQCFGARFKVGVLPEIIRNRLSEIMDNRVELDCIMKIDLLFQYLREDLLLEQMADVMLALFSDLILVEENVVVQAIIKEIEKCKGHINVSEIIDITGYSHRYINYVFKNNVGVSMKKYAEIVRLQESLSCVLNDQNDEIYDELGYYDQAHFIKDFKNFASITPNRMKKFAEEVEFI